MNRSMWVAVTLIAIMGGRLQANQWGHWRGPTGNGTAPSASPPTNWSPDQNIKWKAEIPGRGSGSPVVWDEQVFVVTAVPTRTDSEAAGGDPRRRQGGGTNRLLAFTLLCFDREDGDLLWKRVATVATPHDSTHPTNGFASASPCTDGEHVYAHFGSQGLFAFTLDGELKWKREDLGRMQTRSSFGEGSSPTLAADKILVPWDHEGASFLYALDKATGETIWKTPRDEPSCWATPLVIKQGDIQQVVMNGQNYARGYDLETGKELWRCGGQTARPVASAVGADGVVYVGSGFRGSFLAAFRLNARGDLAGSDAVIWSIDRDTPDIASPLLSDDRLYFHKGKTGLLSCVDAATGESHFPLTRVPGVDTTYASPVAAGGFVFLTDRGGTTTVIRDSSEFEVVASNSVGEGVDATPALVDDQIFIRGEDHLFCIEAP